MATGMAVRAAVGTLEVVAELDMMPTGVTVSHEGRLFVSFPRWGDPVDYTVAEIVDGQSRPYPDAAINRPNPDDPAAALVSVQSVVVDPANRLWLLDTGSTRHGRTAAGGPKLVGVDLETGHPFTQILFSTDVALPSSYLNDVRFDLRRGRIGLAFITDSTALGPNGLIVVDLETGHAWRRLHEHPSTKPVWGFLPIVDGEPLLHRTPGHPTAHQRTGADGIAISADGERLFYCPLDSRRLYSVSTAALADESLPEGNVAETVIDHGEKGAGDGLESDAAGTLYTANYEHNAILRRPLQGEWETLVQDPRLSWPDTLCVATDGYLYCTASQLHRQPGFHDGRDQRQKPYLVFRTPIEAGPVLLQ